MFKKSKSESNEPKGSKVQEPLKKEAAKTPSKTKRSKSSGGGFRAFFVRHVEKLALGFVLALSAFLLYDGTRVTSFSSDKQPTDLANKATDALSKVSQDHWAEIAALPERKIDKSFVDLAKEGKKATDPKWYETITWDPTPKSATEKRGDPDLLPPKFLVGTNVYGAMKVLENKKNDPLSSLEKAKPIEGPKKKEPRPNARGGATTAEGSGNPYAGSGSPSGGGGSPYGDSAGGPGGPGSGGARMLNEKHNRGFGSSDIALSISSSPYGSGSPYTEGSSPSGSPYGPSGGSPYGTAPAAGPAAVKKEEVVKSVLFNAVTAIVPHEVLASNYSHVLGNSMGFNKLRDQPNYDGFQVQRVIVTSDPNREIKEEEWQIFKSASSKSILAARENWGFECKEVATPDWTHTKLSMPIPPILIREYRKFARHPKVPNAGEDEHGNPIGTPGGVMGGGSGYMAGYVDPTMAPTAGGNPYAQSSGSPYGGGNTPGAAEGTVSVTGYSEIPNTKYKLIRFYDFEVQPNQVYRYRVRLLVEDPNYTANVNASPSLQSLKAESLARIQALQVQDAKKSATQRTTSRETAWSDASPPIHVTLPGQFLAGEMKQPVSMENVKLPGNVVVAYEDYTLPTADFVYAEWDKARAVDVPRRFEKASPGTVLTGSYFGADLKSKSYEIVHPLTKAVLADPNYRTVNPVTVLDIRGGTRMGSNAKDLLLSAAEILVVDPMSGQLAVAHEFDDFDAFRMYTFADEVEAAIKAGPTAPAPTSSGRSSSRGVADK